MNPWSAGELIRSTLAKDLAIHVDLLEARRRQRMVFEGLTTAYYPGGKSPALRIYELAVELAGVHGVWVCRGREVWAVHVVGDAPESMRLELFERCKADHVAADLGSVKLLLRAGMNYEPSVNSSWFIAKTRTLQDKTWLKDLSAKYVDDAYRRRVEPYIKRVENGKLVVRRTNGKWSIG